MLRCPSGASAQQSVITGYTIHFIFNPSFQQLAHYYFSHSLNPLLLLTHHTVGAAFRNGILQPSLKNNRRNEALNHSLRFEELFSMMIRKQMMKEAEAKAKVK
jgi:hypothetical protein